MNGNEKLLEIKDLVKHFPIKKGLFSREMATVKAVNGITLDIFKGETVGLVGESGCGKSTLGRAILRLIEPTRGEIILKGSNILKFNSRELRRARRHMQIIFQDPYASLNPRMTVGNIIGEPLVIHNLVKTRKEKLDKIVELLEEVGMRGEVINRYPHEFSGGQRQRIGIARAIALRPEFIVCDEPVSALDVSIQAQVINLLSDLQKKLGLTYLFISHDLKVVEYLSNRVAVMYLGEIVELAKSEDLYRSPKHPYTQALLSAIPVADPKTNKKRIILKGDVPSPISPPSGCPFHTRCHYEIIERCKTEHPPLRELAPSHWVSCHLAK
ncbi:MAG: peptide ABC transporter substrate-binding protein [Deltaproteobacteria bacterium GWA2_38_16]|nr:MAG: peptide ABC transporter substrate-binding protein [Deltaproteobacteria bacterium GWA2_38_16]OGQ02059.1 MAG: peptide ABC transporter substrate-binding protein [Deltaproteobacteria bacterium RIFCSPHIGHO2_02_FULL_38_15]OGQ64226.1 MAG: peptide ABC transporter substrate-binding protein [Deltaproteobacteria bacterium RIFCSPLOWO2_12_FULL_38_8]HBQ21596.1 peptide ABC transporter substrate-binding protein [Deltaproteobacteria bacterium]